MGQFQNQRLDLEIFGLNVRRSLLFCLIQQRLNQCRHLRFGGSIEVQFIQLAGGNFTIKTAVGTINAGL